uniref:mRNA capping enzyme adenylation domain-containing protein n=1 Tax=viral metagenome TaxID=1070528 RepID=A0A6C0BM17_9ZZZZ
MNLDSDLQPTKLYGKTVSSVSNRDLQQAMTHHLLQNYNIRMNSTNKYFMALDPVNDLEIIKKYRHLVYVNTNQKIDLIFLTTIQNHPICWYIDKFHDNFYCLKCQFSSNLYQGTVLEGEYVDGFFLVSDFLVYMGKNIVAYPMDRRVKLLESIIGPDNYHYDPVTDPFQIVMKDFVEPSQLISFVKTYLPTLPYQQKISGLIFRPNEKSNKNLIFNFNSNQRTVFPRINTDIVHPTPIIPLTHIPVLHTTDDEKTPTPTQLPQLTPLLPLVTTVPQKINHALHPQVRFMLFESGNPDDYQLKLVGDSGQLVDYDYALVNDIKTSQYLQNLLDEASPITKRMGICVACQYHPKFDKWKPLQVSHDPPDHLAQLL